MGPVLKSSPSCERVLGRPCEPWRLGSRLHLPNGCPQQRLLEHCSVADEADALGEIDAALERDRAVAAAAGVGQGMHASLRRSRPGAGGSGAKAVLADKRAHDLDVDIAVSGGLPRALVAEAAMLPPRGRVASLSWSAVDARSGGEQGPLSRTACRKLPMGRTL